MKNKRIKLLVIALAILMALTACSTKQSDNSNSKSETKETQQESKTSDANKKLAKLYTKVLDNVDNYDFGDTSGVQILGYEYALVNMKGIDIPLLFVSQRTDFGISAIRIFSTNENFDKEIMSDEFISVGAAGRGGFRGGITLNENQEALTYVYFSSGSGAATAQEITPVIKDDVINLQEKVFWEGRIDQLPEQKTSEIEFHDISDRTIIEDLESKKDS